jgi:hypothetical protein|tara:strand:+ start:505 stop:1044 length:540 start_codon:yes stop_codon:yes gene_type:complete
VKVNEIKVLIRNIVIGSFLIIVGCDTRVGPDYDELFFDVDARLSLDENGYYHLVMERDSWQTLHRISGSVYTEEEPAELIRFNWYSSHYWYIGDTLGYVVSFGLTDDLEYVSYDTNYVTWFNGSEVPTTNCCSYSNSDGEVNNMIAPVQSMIGDTMTIGYRWSDYYNNLNEGTIEIVLD